MSIGFEPVDPSHHHSKLLGSVGWLRFIDPTPVPLQFHKRKLNFYSSRNTLVFASSSSMNKSKPFNAQPSSNVTKDCAFDEILEDPEFQRDELSCFRGLVWDISYRFHIYCRLSKEDESKIP